MKFRLHQFYSRWKERKSHKRALSFIRRVQAIQDHFNKPMTIYTSPSLRDAYALFCIVEQRHLISIILDSGENALMLNQHVVISDPTLINIDEVYVLGS